MTKTNENKVPVILLGNGFNRIGNSGKSWKDLLVELGKELDSGIVNKLDNPFRPFPIAFEDIVLRRKGVYDDEINYLKKVIASKFEDLPKSKLGEKLIHSPINHILTTNYDYSLEKVLIPTFGKNNYFNSTTSEYVHSLMRVKPLGKKRIWHIHGELYNHIGADYIRPAELSILIGFEQYSDYLRKIREYLTAKGRRRLDLNSMEDPDYEIISWVDHFFLNDIYIIGLSMDVSETHLWSILNYRAKLIKSEKKYKKVLNNKIIYISLNITNSTINEKDREIEQSKNKAMIEMLESLKVAAHPIEVIGKSQNQISNELEEKYSKLIDTIVTKYS